PFEQKLFGLVDGQKTIEDILMNTHSGVFRVLNTLDHLRSQNLIGVTAVEEPETEKRDPEIPSSQIIEIAKSKLAFARFDEAINLFQYVLQRDVKNQEAMDLLAKAEEGLVQTIYESVISPDKIPVLARPLEQLAGERLTSEESFLVTRINGR